MVYQPQTHARPHEPSQREIEASDAEVQRFLDDPEAEDVDWETYAASYKWGPDFMRYFNEALAANGEPTSTAADTCASSIALFSCEANRRYIAGTLQVHCRYIVGTL